MARRKALPWRFQTDAATGFDELVVGIGGRPCLLHAEMMNERSIFVTVGDLAIWATADKHGNTKVTHTERRPMPKKGAKTGVEWHPPGQRQRAAPGDK